MKRFHLRFFTPILFSLLIPCTAGFVFSEQEAKPAPAELAAAADTSTLKMPAALAAAGFVKFAEAVQAAELTATLEEEGPFTCFAPTDKAFDAMPEETKKLLKESPAGEQGQTLLKYYFVKGEGLKTDDLMTRRLIKTMDVKRFVTIWVSPGKIECDRGFPIVKPNIPAANGVIHGFTREKDAEDEKKASEKNP